MKHATFIRYCSLFVDGVLEVHQKDTTKVPTLTGGFGEPLNDIIQFMTHFRKGTFNSSLVTSTELGADNGRNYTGCAGKLQRNESDLMINFALYPLDDYDNVYPYLIAAESKIEMFSAYQMIDAVDVTDIADD